MRQAPEFRVLGPLQLLRDGAPVELTSPTQKALLSVLLMRANAPVPNDVLVDAAWEGSPPGRAADTLRVHVSQLRKAVGRDALATVTGGYVLDAPPERVDAHLFAQELARAADLLERGDARGAWERLETALARWRGEAYEDVRFHAFAREEIRRLDDLRLDALERRAQAGLALGRHEQLAGELAEAVERSPHREELWAQLMLALYRCGRQEEALEAFRTAGRRLDEELGLEPGPRLRELERAVLAHDPSLLPTPARARLPAPLTSFVGRRHELAETHARLERSRLVTLVGPGGSGKTRLAIEAARTAPATGGGIWFADLTAVPAGSSPAGTVLGALGRPEGKIADAHAAAEALRGRSGLLVLDNCEHVVEQAGPFVSELLAAADGVSVLATSREPLRVPGEALLHVPPLAVPDDGDDEAETDAVALFLERARDVVPELELTAETRAPILELVRLTSGMPLAIELAAARLDALPLAEAAAQASAAFGTPGRGSRVAVPRHRTLHAALDWSRRLLAPREDEVFRRLWAFRGGWTPDALAAVCADLALGEGELLEALARLVETSMVQLTRRGPEVRYSLLEPVRQYAETLAPDGPERETVVRAHAAHYGALAARTIVALSAGEAAAWHVLAGEEANCVEAVSRLLELDAADEAAAILIPLGRWWGLVGSHDRCRLWCGRVLARRPVLDPDLAAEVVTHAVWNVGLSGDLQAPEVELAREVLADTRSPLCRARLLVQLGNITGLRGELRPALRSLGAAHRILRRSAEPRWYAALVNLACGYAWAGRPGFAEHVARTVADLDEVEPFSRALATALRGQAALYADAPGRAAALLDEALPELDSYGTRFHHGLATVWRGQAALAAGDVPGALARAREAVRLAGDPRELVVAQFAYELLAWSLLAGGELEEARAAVAEAAAVAAESGSPGGRARLLYPAGLLEQRLGAENRAAILLAAGTEARRELRLARPPYEERELERALAALRAGLGARRFRELGAEGATLAAAEAVELALAGTAQPLAS